MTTTYVDNSNVCAKLAEHVASLAEKTLAVKDETSTFSLKHLEPRLRQGLVRIAVVGVTGSGKSTTINALVEKLVLPENPSISSPIPVWLGYQEEDTSVDIYGSQNGQMTRESCGLETFRKKYCYNIKDIQDRDRSRYNSVEFGAVKTDSDILKGNVTLIDTLGISATTVDSRKTIRVLEEGVDAVIFVTKNSKLNLSEMQFLYRHVLGCTSKQNPDASQGLNPRPVVPENLLFVYNNFFGVPSKIEFAERIRAFYQDSGLKLTEQQIETFVANNIFYINALNARLGTLGAYPYVASAPEGCSEMELEAARELEEEESNILKGSNREKLLEESGVLSLRAAVQQLGFRLGHGENSAAVRRIGGLIEVVDGVIQAADTRISAGNMSVHDLQKKKEVFAQNWKDDEVELTSISNGMMALSDRYETSFSRLLTDISKGLVSDCGNRALRMPMPPSFRNQYKTFQQMDAANRELYLNALLPDVIQRTYNYCIEKLLEALDENRTDDYETPFSVMEETRNFMHQQEILLNGRIESLRKAGAEELGMHFPKPMIVETLFDTLGQDLQERVKEIISDVCITGGKAFEKNMGQYIQKCKPNLIQNVLGLVLPNQGAKWQWESIAKGLFKPLAEEIVSHIPELAKSTIYKQTSNAFNSTKDEIRKSHIQLFFSLENTLEELEKKIVNTEKVVSQTETDMGELRKSCEAIKADILSMQYQLQHG